MHDSEFRTGVINPIECVKEGFEIIKSDYWLLFAIGLVGGLIGGVTMYILFGAMICGIFVAYLKKVDGLPVAFDDLWKGMEFFAPSLIVTLVIVVPIFLLYGGTYIAFVGAIVAGSQLGEAGMTGLLIAALAVDMVFVVILVCFHTLLMFSFPLIVDRRLGALDAMKTSAKAVWKNLGGVVGLILVNIGLMIVGYAALCIGMYFVIPIMIAGNAVAYRRVFPNMAANSSHGPPPPNFYRGI